MTMISVTSGWRLEAARHSDWLTASAVLCGRSQLLVVDFDWSQLLLVDCDWSQLLVVDCDWLQLFVVDCDWLQ